ncbi:hypothetical protein [Ramlibacter sp.]|uniref:hypothetical protein n=1 Tax=Ramlibacter sp. TaxID=1917967 RepID=UPI0017E92818|nr:hypothetical protein [Ramlibacter sp.]MBA2675549.1 hypothetical protein [Ramlibacter sp.]
MADLHRVVAAVFIALASLVFAAPAFALANTPTPSCAATDPTPQDTGSGPNVPCGEYRPGWWEFSTLDPATNGGFSCMKRTYCTGYGYDQSRVWAGTPPTGCVSLAGGTKTFETPASSPSVVRASVLYLS